MAKVKATLRRHFPHFAVIRRLALALVAAMALGITAPAFGACGCGVRTPRFVVIGERKRAGLLTPAEAAAAVGVAENILRGELQAGRLKARVIGGRWYIKQADLDKWWRHFAERAGKTSEGKRGKSSETDGSRSTHEEKEGMDGGDTVAPVSAAAAADITAEPSEFITPKEAARIAGVTTKTIDNWASRGYFDYYPRHRARGSIKRIRRSEFLAWWEGRDE